MPTSFSFKEESSPIFGKIRRPVANVFFRHLKKDIWQPVNMLIDTGADYTLLPKFLANPLGVALHRDCKIIRTEGVGGASNVFLLKGKIQIKIGDMKRSIPLGFLLSDSIPPLLGRHEFFETFRVVFENHSVTFS